MGCQSAETGINDKDIEGKSICMLLKEEIIQRDSANQYTQQINVLSHFLNMCDI